MHYSTSRIVQDAHPKELVVVDTIIRTQKSMGAPDRMDDYWIDKSGQHDRVEEIGIHLAAFSERTGDNRGGSGTKCILKEPKGQVVDVVQKEIGSANKGVWIRPIAEGKGVPDTVKG
jgi:hypothetical protein